MRSKPRFLKPGWIIIGLIILFVTIKSLVLGNSFTLNKDIVIEKGDTMASFYRELGSISSLKTRRYLKQHSDILHDLQPGKYVFSGSYTPETFVATINKGPNRNFNKITILEGWSMYDIDEFLTSKGYISGGEYKDYVTDILHIDELASDYEFVKNYKDTKNSTSPLSLEGLLYPDTYHLSLNDPIVPQLVRMQLKAFEQKVYSPLAREITSFGDQLKKDGYSLNLSWYDIVTLASIVEKEERSNTNKPTVAGIFLNRLSQGMRIDADITLCYGLAKGYESCPPKVIVASINDENNVYNTRKNTGLTPSPIANPSAQTFKSVLGYDKTQYLFYLHDSAGKIWYAVDNEGHVANKQQHL